MHLSLILSYWKLVVSVLTNSIIHRGHSPITSNKIHRTSSLVSYQSVTSTALTFYANWLHFSVSKMHLSLLLSYWKLVVSVLTNSVILCHNSLIPSSKSRRTFSLVSYESVTATASTSYANWLHFNVSSRHLSLLLSQWKLDVSVLTNSVLYRSHSTI